LIPASPLERKFQEVRKLPKKKQDFILQFLDTALEKQSAKAKGVRKLTPFLEAISKIVSQQNNDTRQMNKA
jgi:hypothetical protein